MPGRCEALARVVSSRLRHGLKKDLVPMDNNVVEIRPSHVSFLADDLFQKPATLKGTIGNEAEFARPQGRANSLIRLPLSGATINPGNSIVWLHSNPPRFA